MINPEGIEKSGESRPRMLAEGKTKRLWKRADGNTLVESKDDITAGDGLKRDMIPNKARLATQTTSNCFELLNRAGIPNHFRGRQSENTFLAKEVKMIPLELVARRVAAGSYLNRNHEAKKGDKFTELEFEIFHKDDPNHDPLVILDFETGLARRHKPKEPVSEASLIDTVLITDLDPSLTPERVAELKELTTQTFEVLEAAWADQDVTLVDLKIECGITPEGECLVADVIDNDSWRIWPSGDPERMLDKQGYREGHDLSTVARNYAIVAEATNDFVR